MKTNRLFALAVVVGTLTAAPALASTIVVTAASPDGWTFSNTDNAGTNASGGYEVGPGSPPAGTGSAQFNVGATNSSEILFQNISPTSASNVSNLDYFTYVTTSTQGSGAAVNLEFDIRNGQGAYEGRLTFDPGLLGSVSDNIWQEWDASSSTNVAWYFSHATVGNCSLSNYCSFATVQSDLASDGYFLTAVVFKAGSGQASFDGNVDKFTIDSTSGDTTYDFEPTAVPEPADLAIFGSALALLGLMAFRRRRNAATI